MKNIYTNYCFPSKTVKSKTGFKALIIVAYLSITVPSRTVQGQCSQSSAIVEGANVCTINGNTGGCPNNYNNAIGYP